MKIKKKLDEQTVRVLDRLRRDLIDRVREAEAAKKLAQAECNDAVLLVLKPHGLDQKMLPSLELEGDEASWDDGAKAPDGEVVPFAQQVAKTKKGK